MRHSLLILIYREQWSLLETIYRIGCKSLCLVEEPKRPAEFDNYNTLDNYGLV